MGKKSTPIKPGQSAPWSGQYEIVGPRGGKTGVEITLVKGKVAPPSPKPNQTLVLVDPTNNQSGKGK
ncbi:MAG: hypothetical protein F9K46_18035 [Anaerolineae bacterium]|nr:MAG: hypothetical protein F9K46_18035 [Anaerolineae bacterium]